MPYGRRARVPDPADHPCRRGLVPTTTTSTVGAVQAERDLTYLGLAVFHTPLKEGSAPALKMLADSSHQLVMITGDAPLTACFTAAQVHITDRPVLILNCDKPVIIGSTGASLRA